MKKVPNILGKKYQQDKFNKLAEPLDIKDKIKIVRWANALERFIFTIAKFLVLTWIFTKYYKSAGFDIVVITLLVIIITILISNGRKEDKFSAQK